MQKHNLKCRLIDGKVSVCTEAGTNTPLNVVMAQMKCESTYSPSSTSSLRCSASAPHDYSSMQPRSPTFDTTTTNTVNSSSMDLTYNSSNYGKPVHRRTLSAPMTQIPITSPSLDLSAISPEMLWPTSTVTSSGDDHAAWMDMLIGTLANDISSRR